MKRILSVFLIILPFCQFFAQSILTPKDKKYLEEELFNGNVERIEKFFSEKDMETEEGTYSENNVNDYNNVKNEFLNVVTICRNQESIKDEMITASVKRRLSLEKEFEPLYAGEKGAKLFERFTMLAADKNYREALKVYNIAEFFKRNYKAETINKFRINTESVYRIYLAQDFDKAEKKAVQLLSDIKDLELPESLTDSVRLLNEKIGESKKNYQKAKTLYKNQGSLPDDKITAFVDKYKSFSAQFDSSRAGAKAYEYYRTFSDLAADGNNREAIKYYNIAHFYKGDYITQKRSEIRGKTKTAYNFFESEKYDEAKVRADKLLSETEDLRLPSSIIDSIKALKEKIVQNKNEIKRNEHLWHDKRVINEQLTFAAGVNMINQIEIAELEFEVVNEGDIPRDEPVILENLPGSFVASYFGSLRYRILDNFSAGFALGYAEFQYSSEQQIKLIYSDFSLNNYSGYAFLFYQTKHTVGIRPFAAAGLGYNYYNRDKSVVRILQFLNGEDEPPTEFVYYLPEWSQGSLSTLFEGGVEYIPAPDINIVVGAKFSGYLNFASNPYMNKFNFSFGGYIGFWL